MLSKLLKGDTSLDIIMGMPDMNIQKRKNCMKQNKVKANMYVWLPDYFERWKVIFTSLHVGRDN